MPFVELIVMVAVLQYVFFAAATGRTRARSGLQAPATTGDEGFERMYRVQMNTLELLVALLPSLLIASHYWPASVVTAIGGIYIIGRHIYWRAYVREPAKRSLGFALSILPVLALLIMAVTGALLAIIGQ